MEFIQLFIILKCLLLLNISLIIIKHFLSCNKMIQVSKVFIYAAHKSFNNGCLLTR